MNPKILFLLSLVCLFFYNSSCELLLPFGNDPTLGLNVDSSLSGVDDGHVTVDLKTPFLINHQQFSSVFINVDGILTFTGPSYSYELRDINGPSIAPFWGDVDLSGVVEHDKEANTLYYRVSERPEDIEWVRNALEEAVGHQVQWRPKTVVVATWDRVGYFMAQTSQLNTFQVVLATDGYESFSFFNYPPNSMNWWVTEQGQTSTIGFRTTTHEFLVQQTTLEEIVTFLNNTNTGVSGRLVFKFDGSRPLLSQIKAIDAPCFFGGGSISISGHGFIESETLKCRFSNSKRSFESEAKFISFNEVSCEVPVWESNQILNVSVSNRDQLFSEELPFLVNDCILSFNPIKTCFGGGLFTVESFPVSWNPNNKYSCYFGDKETQAQINDDVLTCPLPEFEKTSGSVVVPLKVGLIEETTGVKVNSSQFGTLQFNHCQFIFNRLRQCTARKLGVFWETPLTQKTKGMVKYPSGQEKSIEIVGKFVEIAVPEDGSYSFSVSGFSTSVEVLC